MKWHERFNQSGFSRFLNSPAGRVMRFVVGVGFVVVGYMYRDAAIGVIAILWGLLAMSAGGLDVCYLSVVLGGPLSGKKIRQTYPSPEPRG